ITTRLRGLAYTELRVRAAARDLHSGLFGGSALNAANLLARILGELHDAQGRVAVPGFYDGAAEPSAAEKASWAKLGFDEAAFLGGIGLSHPAGERDRSPLERLWGRPTADVNGLWGGYAGPGAKTVIPAEAGAKVSFRLVPGQDPEQVVARFRRFVDAFLPPDARAEVVSLSTAPGIAIPADSRFVHAAEAALRAEFGRPAVLIGSGGSIPVVESLRRLLGLDTLLMGFGLDDDQVHSPDEKFDLACFTCGTRAHARLLGQLAQ
ncbi:MAG: M20/M25/M40 family metallo-hydrolase, partial [Acetobacteraceae bacterium]|nr:M20/M25/M40 family metallo-hydrolase [Acetobacteraceae bacterium]